MADVHTPQQRSFNMSRIKGKNTKPEMLVRRYLHSQGFRYKLHDKALPGKPDLVLPKYKTIIFIHGCFWHGHENCKYSKLPETRADWWQQKINKNITNDEKAVQLLNQTGWKVIIVWSCNLMPKKLPHTLEALVKQLI